MWKMWKVQNIVVNPVLFSKLRSEYLIQCNDEDRQ